MLQDSTLTRQGQTTVPAAVREQISAQPGATLRWHVLPDGAVLMRVKSQSIADLAGSLAPRLAKGKARVSVEQMTPFA